MQRPDVGIALARASSSVMLNMGERRPALWLRGIVSAGLTVILFIPTIALVRAAAGFGWTLRERTEFVAEGLAASVVRFAVLGAALLVIHQSLSWMTKHGTRTVSSS
jgi:hypothetical protein